MFIAAITQDVFLPVASIVILIILFLTTLTFLDLVLDELQYLLNKSIESSNESFILTILLSLIEHGFHKFYISVNYKKEIIKDYFGNGSKWNIQINYIEENKRLGTAGSLSLIKENFKEPILITNGDVITNLDYQRFIKH